MDTSTSLQRFMRHGRLHELAAFDTVMRVGSFGQAAMELNIAQSTLSGHLRKLSDTLDVQLFEAQGRRRVPTPAARLLHGTVAAFIVALRQTDRSLRDLDRHLRH